MKNRPLLRSGRVALKACFDLSYRGRPPWQAASGRCVLGNTYAGEEQAVQGLAKQRWHEAVGERHAGRTGAERVGHQVHPALSQAGRKLSFAILPVVESLKVSRGDHDERGIAPEPLVAADVVELITKLAGAQRHRQVRPAIDTGRDTVDVVYRDPL